MEAFAKGGLSVRAPSPAICYACHNNPGNAESKALPITSFLRLVPRESLGYP